MTLKLFKSSFILFLFFIQIRSAHSLPIQETYFYTGQVTADLISRWSSRSTPVNYILELGWPGQPELEQLSKLKFSNSLLTEVSYFPNEDFLASWQKLAENKATFVSLGIGLPNIRQIEILNKIGFEDYLFVLTAYPTEENAQNLSLLSGNITLSFFASRYPRYEEKDGLLAIPSNAKLHFTTDYWPWYSHMDVLNFLPHKKSLRVKGIFPSGQTLEYLHNIKNLKSITVETDFDAPYAKDWKQFKNLPVTWISKDHIPSERGLSAFEGSFSSTTQRKLILDLDWPLSPNEKERIESSPIPTNWIHQAPQFKY